MANLEEKLEEERERLFLDKIEVLERKIEEIKIGCRFGT